MSEPIWYYSQDGRECGPVTLGRLVELSKAGTVKPSDLVWREGMSDWVPSARVEELRKAATAAESKGGGTVAQPSTTRPKPPDSRPPISSVVASFWRDLLSPGSRSAQILLIGGIVLVITARGCDALGQRNVAWLAAKQAATRQWFDDSYETRRLKIQQSLDRLAAKKPAPTDAEKTEIERLKGDLTSLLKEQADARKELAEGAWRDLELAARNAQWTEAMWAYWRELLFVVGSMAFTVGLILVGFSGQPAERWVALAMLAIVAYSIYVGGAAWGPNSAKP